MACFGSPGPFTVNFGSRESLVCLEDFLFGGTKGDREPQREGAPARGGLGGRTFRTIVVYHIAA